MYCYNSLNISFLKYFNFLIVTNFLQMPLMIQLRTFKYLLKSRKYLRHIDLSVFVGYFPPFHRWETLKKKDPWSTQGSLYSLDITHFLGSWSFQEVLGCICVNGCVLRHAGLIFLCYLPVNSLHAESPTPEQLSSITNCRSTLIAIDDFILYVVPGPSECVLSHTRKTCRTLCCVILKTVLKPV